MNTADLKRRIILKELVLKPNPNKRLKSPVWETLHCIYDLEDDIVEGYVSCTSCNLVLKQATDGGTKNLLDHTKKCSLKKIELKQQTSIGTLFNNIEQTMAINKIKTEHKASITRALSQMSF